MRLQVISLLLILILSLIGMAVIVLAYDPFSAEQSVKNLFFAAMFLFLFSVSGLVFFTGSKLVQRRGFEPQEVFYRSLRRGFVMAMVLEAALIFSHLQLFNWYSFSFLIAFFFVVELLASKGQYKLITQ